MKASRLQGIAVVSIANGSKEGTVRDLVLDPNRRRVVALTIKPTGGGNDKIVLIKDVHSAGRDAITIPDADVLKEEHPARGDGEVRLSKMKGMKALTESGQVEGTITEVEIDPDSFAILGYELSTGAWSSLTGNRKRLPADERLHYGRDVLVVREGTPSKQAKESRTEARAEEKEHARRY